MNSKLKKFVITVSVVAVVVVVCVLLSLRPVENFHDKYANTDLSVQIEGLERTGTYSDYVASFGNAAYPTKDIAVDVMSYKAAGKGDVRTNGALDGVAQSLYTEMESEVTWTVKVPAAGFYNLYLDYYLPDSKGVEAERSVLINGVAPFEDAKSITFSRVWKDKTVKRIDNQGNEIRPTQVEEFVWQNAYLRDERGYTQEPYLFYFNEGKNTITFVGDNEPMIISGLTLKAVTEAKTYAQYLASVPSTSSAAAESFETIIEGEDSTYRSESSLYAKYDRSSPITSPQSVAHTVLNYIGGETWRTNGQWIEWDIEVPADGFYNIMVKAKQNYARGTVSNRALYIDGEIPFEEVSVISFPYDNDWQCRDLADEDGTPYNFYLTKGKHTIRLQATLGELGQILGDLEDSTFRLNQIYRKILVYTGASPDKYRDYHITDVYPEMMKAMDLESKRLYKIVDDMVAYAGQKADSIATAQTVAVQLERFIDKPQNITTEFVSFKDNITALGTAALTLNEMKLDIDYIEITGTKVESKDDHSNFFKNLWHEIKSFFASFFIDYNSVGDVYDGDDICKVWVLTGRDQGTILKAMIDDTFTPDTGIPVNVEIVAADSVMNAVMAGRGPNVVISIGADKPVNFALRGAVEDITQFPDYQEVLSHYSPSSYTQCSLDGHIYAVPETQTFLVMFYRKDVLDELELEVPQTWDDLIAILPTIQGNNLSVGLPSAAGSNSSSAATTSATSNNPDLSLFFSMMFQNGGDLYNEKGTKTIINTEAGIKAFKDYAKFFNSYGLPQIYDFVSRFRSGEMPIGIAAYSVYNTLVVSAPEIRGLWDFTLIPGTERTREDGTTYIDRSDCITGSMSLMFKTEDEKIKNDAWQFMKWWAKPETQTRFGREIEALLGSSARYATANRDAFSSLSWSAEDIKILQAQWDETVGIREVPGGYFTGRHVMNALRSVTGLEKTDAREAIIDYSILIDEELTKKRKEFGLPLD